eukprot:gnl/TRDRNA2_/TRDRNA2_174032_c3_seq5.p1 gnl/TRDRNA2_/TRDRNA2_174032_c3~~gnl/TRDRNA2_/TRDRNA2_174032_c3_seq5.p1  ORF type:complete len:182 (-),score=4.08 gnl/TRDRNA2_/TRDRNA2_174032_c3_seq5:270-815(-)
MSSLLSLPPVVYLPCFWHNEDHPLQTLQEERSSIPCVESHCRHVATQYGTTGIQQHQSFLCLFVSLLSLSVRPSRLSVGLLRYLSIADSDNEHGSLLNSDHPSSVCTESLLPASASLGHSILCFQTIHKEDVPTACFQSENCTVACSIAVACLFSTIKPLVLKTNQCLCHTIPYQLISPMV